MRYDSKQENFWHGEFGTDYASRNSLSPKALERALALWSEILPCLPQRPATILELGSNIGINLHALKRLLPEARLTAVEINPAAAESLKNSGIAQVLEQSILELDLPEQFDLVLIMGVLIHIGPESLPQAYKVMDRHSRGSLVLSTYYNPTRRAVSYRGHTGVLFQGDFAGEFMDAYPAYRLRGYRFHYHRDPACPGNDATWFALAK